MKPNSYEGVRSKAAEADDQQKCVFSKYADDNKMLTRDMAGRAVSELVRMWTN